MSVRSVFSTAVLVLAMGVAPSVAQETLGDLVSSGGYDWIIGRWAASPDDGQKVEFDFAWALDKHVVLNSMQAGDFRYQGLITMSPTDQEAVDQGVDNRGGLWKGVWSPEGDGLVRKVEHTGPNGQVRKGDIVVTKGDGDTITIAIYSTDGSGNRNSEPMSKLTYKRQPQAKVAPVSAAAEDSGRATDYQKLGDLVAEGGYTWLIGKWAGNENNQTYELEYQPILDKHAASVDMKIGGFRYTGLITYAPSRQEVVEFGADTRGRTWKMVWAQDGSDLAARTEVTQADGTTQKFQHVFAKIDNDTFKGKLYALTADGSRGSDPVEQVTFKRQKPATPQTKETK